MSAVSAKDLNKKFGIQEHVRVRLHHSKIPSAALCISFFKTQKFINPQRILLALTH